MKKYFGLFFLMLLLNGCDDGDVKVEEINFDSVTASSCGDIVYKVSGNEVLFLKIPIADAFINEVTPAGSPRTFDIGGTVSVRYRGYNGNVTADNICPDVIQPISPVATVEWIATAGKVEITTTPVMSLPDATTGATRLTGFNHDIVFRNIVFEKPTGRQIYDEFIFGNFTTTAITLPLDFDPASVHLCPSGTTLYNVAGGGIAGMFIQNLDPALLSTSILNTPKQSLISTTANKLSYRLLTTAIPSGTYDDYFCPTTIPATPEINEEWLADEGVTDVSGIIEVVTITDGTNAHLHTIHLKGVTFRKGNNTFYYGNDIIFGQLITN